MTANPILLQKKYARIVARYAGKYGMSLADALDLFYHSEVYQLMSQGIADMHCMSDEYLVEELYAEQRDEKKRRFLP